MMSKKSLTREFLSLLTDIFGMFCIMFLIILGFLYAADYGSARMEKYQQDKSGNSPQEYRL
jgi:TRAP-type C4-dicarboxylate transport system permease small subunit